MLKQLMMKLPNIFVMSGLMQSKINKLYKKVKSLQFNHLLQVDANYFKKLMEPVASIESLLLILLSLLQNHSHGG